MTVELSEPGWAHFGRGVLPRCLRFPILDVPSSPRLGLTGLVSPHLARRFATDDAFADDVGQFFGARPDLVRRIFRAGPPSPDTAGLLVVDRPYPTERIPSFSGDDYRLLRNGRCFKQRLVAELATALLPEAPVEAETIRRLEDGATTRCRRLCSRLDVVYNAGGYSCNDLVYPTTYRSPLRFEFPPYWRGPLWFEFTSEETSPVEVRLRRRSAVRTLRVRSGATVTSACWTGAPDPYLVDCPSGWRVAAGMGARPGAPRLALDPLPPRTPTHDIHDQVLHLFTRPRPQFDQLLKGE